MPEAENSNEFDELLDLLKRSRGFDFSGYKRASLIRRVRRRMQMVGAETYGDYMAILRGDPAEFDHLFNTVLINVTSFFRDTIPWGYLAEEILPQLFEGKEEGAPIRAWSAGCATGQEAFTLAMVLAEALGVEKFLQRVKIYATDLDEDALTYARAATYTEKEVSAVPALLLERYFERSGAKFVFRKDMRRAVIFGRNDLVRHAPISRIDILVCRNTLMYFDAATQAKIVSRFHFALNEGGYLLLGKAETLSAHPSLFAPLDIQKRVFRRIGPHHRAERLPVAWRDPTGKNENEIERGALCDASFEKSAVAQFVVTRRGLLALANERARTLFRLGPADVGRSFHDLELSYRPLELRSHIEQLFLDERPMKLIETPWPLGPEERWFDVALTPIYGDKRVLEAVNVTFDDVSNFRRVKNELNQSHADLQAAYEELQSTNEELETTNEELQSTVEELETTNEELQSTNEELETMNEELQAINEEHGVANLQLRETGQELRDLNSYLEAIFASLGGGVAIIDPEMRVRIWNRRAEDLWGIRADEAVNHHFLDLDIGLPVTELKPIIRAAMNDGGASHEITVRAVNRRGRTIQCRVVSTPLMTPGSDRPQGAIVVMEENADAAATN
jgi:two-component system, chemotaxis family, CheB/CheR fusion protein